VFVMMLTLLPSAHAIGPTWPQPRVNRRRQVCQTSRARAQLQLRPASAVIHHP
jgi:hypothetical protein